jgi:dihydroorotate dehydrogenase
MDLYTLLRPLLFKLDPETAHNVTLKSLDMASRLGPLNPLHHTSQGRSVELMGLRFPNPVGLAAGLDKDGACIAGLAALGFGALEMGTVTPKAQPGNPKPRLFRVLEAEGIINRMGFNNAGVDTLLARAEDSAYRGILGINIGKNKDTPVESALEDYRLCLRKVYAVADYVTINISSPNTPGLRSLQSGDSLETLLAGLALERKNLLNSTQRRVPIAVKIAPDLDQEGLEQIADSLLRHGFDAVIATNTTLSRAGVERCVNGNESGGLSGRPVYARSTAIVEALAKQLNGRLPIIACGGIFSREDAQGKLDAGASMVQVYSGLIYRGPRLIKELVEGL